MLEITTAELARLELTQGHVIRHQARLSHNLVTDTVACRK